MISLYEKGLTTGDIQQHLLEIYGKEVSRETFSKITDHIVEEMLAWQSRDYAVNRAVRSRVADSLPLEPVRRSCI